MNIANRLLLLASAFLVLSACSGSSGGGSATSTTPPERAAGMLSEASSAANLERSVKQGLKNAFNINNIPLGLDSGQGLDRTFAVTELASSADAGGAGSFTQTYTLEAGVGEADVLKYDGSVMYTLLRPDPDFGIDAVYGAADIRVLQTDPDTAAAETLATISLQHDLAVEGLYLPEPGRLVVLQSSGFYGTNH